jgi:RNA-binding protein YhbY
MVLQVRLEPVFTEVCVWIGVEGLNEKVGRCRSQRVESREDEESMTPVEYPGAKRHSVDSGTGLQQMVPSLEHRGLLKLKMCLESTAVALRRSGQGPEDGHGVISSGCFRRHLDLLV